MARGGASSGLELAATPEGPGSCWRGLPSACHVPSHASMCVCACVCTRACTGPGTAAMPVGMCTCVLVSTGACECRFVCACVRVFVHVCVHCECAVLCVWHVWVCIRMCKCRFVSACGMCGCVYTGMCVGLCLVRAWVCTRACKCAGSGVHVACMWCVHVRVHVQHCVCGMRVGVSTHASVQGCVRMHAQGWAPAAPFRPPGCRLPSTP